MWTCIFLLSFHFKKDGEKAEGGGQFKEVASNQPFSCSSHKTSCFLHIFRIQKLNSSNGLCKEPELDAGCLLPKAPALVCASEGEVSLKLLDGFKGKRGFVERSRSL